MEKEFYQFIYERQLIWYKREILQQDPPWTDDPVMRQFKIINMYRELDRCTRYIMRKVAGLKSKEAQLINIIFYRFFNADQLYEQVGVAPFERLNAETKKRLIDGFAQMRQSGKRLFNPAYLISPGHAQRAKHLTILDHLETVSKDIEQYMERLEAAQTPEESFVILQEVPLAGPFLCCEFWTDLAYIDFFPQGWTDNDFVNIGPGAKWGLEIMAGRKLKKKEQWDMLLALHKGQEKVLPHISEAVGGTLLWEDIAYKDACSNVPFLSLTNVEGALCEFRKYTRFGKGKGRRRYFEPTA